jgi:gliding motility-associated-like protein
VPLIQINQILLCDGSRQISVINESEYASDVIWNMGDGTILNDWEPVHEYAQDGEYIIVATLTSEVCNVEDVHTVLIQRLQIPNVLTRNGDGKNDAFKIGSIGSVDLTIYTRWGTKVYRQLDYQNDWSAEGLSNGIYYYEVVLENKEICNGWLHLLDTN